MLKSVQIKIIIIFMLLGIVCIAGLGVFFIGQMHNISQIVQNENINTTEVIQTHINKMELIVLYGVGLFLIISVIVGFFVSKVIIRPISSLIKTAERIVAGEDVEIKYLSDGKSGSEIDDLVKHFQ